MNKRIKELEKLATDTIDAFDGPIGVFNLEKFTELVVRECAKIADAAEPYKANDLILKHFGVKE